MTKLATLVTIFLLGPAAAAGAEVDERGRALLDRFVQDVRSLSARFDQSLVDDSDTVVEESSGTVEILRPGRFRWEYSTPYEQLLVADGMNVWSYDADLAQVTVKPQQEVIASTPALLIGGTARVLDEFEYIDSLEDRGTTWVRLRPRDANAGFGRIELGFTNGDLSRMMFADNLEQTTLIALFDVVLNGELDEARFRFVPPAGADLVGEPASPSQADR